MFWAAAGGHIPLSQQVRCARLRSTYTDTRLLRLLTADLSACVCCVQAVKDAPTLWPATATNNSATQSAVESSGTVPVAYSSSFPSTLTNDPASIAKSSMGTDAFATGLTTSGAVASRAGDSSTESMSALLKARSDAAVLKDLKLGPLIGSGSFGRVFRGEAPAATRALRLPVTADSS